MNDKLNIAEVARLQRQIRNATDIIIEKHSKSTPYEKELASNKKSEAIQRLKAVGVIR